MKQTLLRILALVTVLFLLGSGLSVAAARPQTFDENGRMPLITEPDGSVEPLIFCRGDQDLTMDEVQWVDGLDGKAVKFSGIDEYFRIGYNYLQLADFTLSMWVNWSGAAEGGSGELNQRIFSIRGSYHEQQYMTLSPMESTGEGTDALRLHMRYQNTDWELHRPQASPLATDEWHHIAVVATEQTLALYLDGVLMAESLTMMGIADMRPQQLYLGKGPTYGGDGYFNGLMDNVYLYKKALTVDELATVLSEQTPTTAPTTSTEPEDIPDAPLQTDYSLPAIPSIVWILVGMVTLLILALIITVNIQYAKEQKPTTSADRAPDSTQKNDE